MRRTPPHGRTTRRSDSGGKPGTARPTVTGEYDATGYAVLVDGKPVYAAGNHRQDSSCSAAPGSPEALTLGELRRYCVRTAREIAKEARGAYGGVLRTQREESP